MNVKFIELQTHLTCAFLFIHKNRYVSHCTYLVMNQLVLDSIDVDIQIEKILNENRQIIQDLNNWVAGWVDWNMALDTQVRFYYHKDQRSKITQFQGGFTWAGNYVDAPIVVDGEEFYKQPMYYAMAHFR